MVKEMERVKNVINNEIGTYAILLRNSIAKIGQTDCFAWNQVGHTASIANYSIRLDQLYYLAYELEMIDSIDCFRDAVHEYTIGKRGFCPTTDDFKLDEMEVF